MRLLPIPAAALCLAAPLAAQTVIDFDYYPGPDGMLGTGDDVPITAPDLFSQQSLQLTDEFSSVGVLFTPDPPINDRNEILNSNTFNTPPGHTLPNLLASQGSQEIEGEFTVAVSSVSALIGISGGSDELEIYDANGTSLGSAVGNDVVVTLSSSTPIARFVVRNEPGTGSTTPAIDNLTFDGGGLRLSLTGSCPGTVTLDVSGATANGTVAIGWSPQQGTFTIPSGYQCAGTTLDLASPQILTTLGADANGDATFTASAPAAACGVSLQAVDLTSCETSNVVLVQ